MSNREIIERYYREHHSELLAFATIRLHNNEEAADIVQEAFLKLLSEQRPICENTIGNLAYTMCRHLIIDYYRRHATRTDVAHELARSTMGSDSAEHILSMRDLTEQLERSLARLAPECQDIYRLHVYGGMKARDICDATGERYKHVEYQLGIARKHVRNYLRHIS